SSKNWIFLQEHLIFIYYNYTVVQRPVSEPVYEGDPVTLQCSLLSDSENKACPAGHSVFWFRAGSDESHPRIIYTHGNRSDGCEKSPEAGSPPQSCVYNFSKNSGSSSDAGTYYCAVATCGEILFGNGAKLDIKAVREMKNKPKKKVTKGWACVYVDMYQMITFCHVIPQRNEATLVYSAPTFTRRTGGDGRMRPSRAAEKETVYSDVKGFGWK
uniref:Ig-like domain-containing protein n=1 Tax=Myripristis murdjan TaxID=586833 RepID=A0A667WZ20_9TELE